MEEDKVSALHDNLDQARKLREDADSIEEYVAEVVGYEVMEWLDSGKKSKALEVIGKVYSEKDERTQYWFKYFQKIIFTYM